jgi:hypothetical protein
MRYPVSEKLEIIRLVEESALPVRRTLEKIGIPRATFYRWYDLYRVGGPEALDDRHPKPDRVWNRIPDDVRERIIRLALDEPALSPMLAVSKTLTTHTAALFCYSIVSKLYRLGTRPNHSNSEHVQLGVGADSGGGMSEDDVGF